MNENVSIVLCRPVRNYRKLAQEWYGLSDEQMVGVDVHHNPPVYQGGQNIPEHLYVYHSTLHNAVHGDDFTKWARIGGSIGGKKQPKEIKRQNALKGIAIMPREQRQLAGRARAAATNKYMPIERKRELAQQMRDKTPREVLVNAGIKCRELKLGAFGMTPEDRHFANVKGGKAGGRKAQELGVGLAAMTKEQRQEAGRKGARNRSHEDSVKGGRNAARTLWVDPDHPELGAHNAGNLVQKQRSLGLPHGKENRVKSFNCDESV
jgi:hypothetical protein